MPINKWGFILIRVDAHNSKVNSCKNSLIGRLILAKGEEPWKLKDLKAKLTSLWNIQHP